MKTGKLVKPENTLKKKVGNGGFTEGDLIKAQRGIESNDIDFRPLATDLITELDQTLADIDNGKITNDNQKRDTIMYPLMQLKSQGGLFNYPIVSSLSHSTLDFIENIHGIDPDVIAIVVAYKKSIQAVLSLQIKQPDHPAGKQLITELHNAFERYKKAQMKKA